METMITYFQRIQCGHKTRGFGRRRRKLALKNGKSPNTLLTQQLCRLRKIPNAGRYLSGSETQLLWVLQEEMTPMISGEGTAVKRLLHQIVCQLDLLLVVVAEPRIAMGKVEVPQWPWPTILSILAPDTAVGVARWCHQK